MAPPRKDVNKLTGAEKAAILLLCLGEEPTAKIFENLTDAEVERISRCMVEISHVPAHVTNHVLLEFKKSQEELGLFVEGDRFLRNALANGDPRRAELLLEQVSSIKETRPLETIAMMQPRMVAGLLEREHPQTVALILSTQKPEHTARVLSFFAEELKGEIMYRIAKIDKVSPDVLSNIEDVLQREIGAVGSKEQQQVGGIDKVVEILGRMDKGADRTVLGSIELTDADMAEEIRRKMFTFEDLSNLDNRALQTILREVNNDQLTLALKAAPDHVKDKIFANVSSRAAEMIREDLEAMGPVRLSEVENIQQTIVKIALKLEENGQIVIPGRGGNDALV